MLVRQRRSHRHFVVPQLRPTAAGGRGRSRSSPSADGSSTEGRLRWSSASVSDYAREAALILC